MKYFSRIIAGVISLLMAAMSAGCSINGDGSKEGKSERKGGYVEETVELGDNDLSLSEFTQKDDCIKMFDINNCDLYSLSGEEKNFTGEVPSDIIGKMPVSSITSAAISPEGDYYYEYYDPNTYEIASVYLSSDGSEHKIETDELVLSAEFSCDNRLFVVTDGGVYEVNTNNFSLRHIFDTGYNINAFDIAGDNIIVVDENGVKMYDYKNDKETEVSEALNNFFINYTDSQYNGELSFDICSDDKNNLYILSEDGIFRYAVNGNQIEKILDGSKYQIGSPDNTIHSLVYLDDGSFYVSFKNGSLIKYRYDPELVNKKTSVLKIYSLKKNDTLSQIIRNYSLENKNVEVDYLVGMRSGMTYEDAVKNLTTQILSGNAPDIILLDGLDIENCIDKNMLLDLSASEKQWNRNGNLLDNIAKWNDHEGKIYSVACKFRIPAVAASQKDLEKIKDYSDIADYVEKTRKEKNPETAVTYMTDSGMVIRNALIYEGNELFAGTDISREKLREFYENCAKVYKNDQPEGGGIYITGCSNGESVETEISDEYSIGGKLCEAIADPDVMALGTLNSFEKDINYATSIDSFTDQTELKFRYGLNSESKVFIPECNLGIIENSKNHEDAVKFITQALNAETQKIDYNDGLPVNCDALDYYYKKNEDTSNEDYIIINHTSSEKSLEKGVRWNLEWMSDKEVNEFDSYIRSLNDPLYIDGVTRNIIIDEGINCLEGTISADQAADDAVSQLELKMKE